uniref:Uncharacterized protein n=1 Tax=Poecilia latipinna TaxID=48699 RepID=A0A3B3W0H5_9TELE
QMPRLLLRPGIANPCRLLRAVTQISERSFVHQEGLPKLPVPPLKQTCERYLAALEPISTLLEDVSTSSAHLVTKTSDQSFGK